MKNKIRVIFLIGELGKGGSERQLYLLLKYMDFDVIEPHVIVFNQSSYAVYNDELINLGVSVEVIPKEQRKVISRLLYIYKRARRIRPHVIQSWTSHDNPYAGIVGFFSRIPLKLGALRSSINNKGFASLPRIIQLICLYSTQFLVINAESIKTELIQRNYPKQKIILLENCVEICDKAQVNINEELEGLGITNFKRIIGTVGNITRNKNLHIFIEGLGRIIDKYPDICGVVVGQPMPNNLDYYLELQEMLSRKQLSSRIFLTGFLDDIPELMHHLYIFCLLSSYEGTPNVILEAMAASRPVIASNVGGISQIITDGYNGLLVNPGDIDSFVHSLICLIESADLAENMGDAGFNLVMSQYDCREKSKQLGEIYKNLLGNSV